ncbi:MAG: hypothetical protein IT440_03015 [Phycisphaeraceae bacterium]|nr:hypothetical protein [Phycisphaeraceae bacterium]
MRGINRLGVMVVATVSLMGCSSYVVPSGRADLKAISSYSMRESFAAAPAAQFPTYIAVVRVQAPNYRSYYTSREGGVYGDGRYSIVTVRDVEDDADMQRIRLLPQVGGLISVPTMLMPVSLQSDKELREAAARLKADMVLIYTFNTTFHENENVVALSVITLGLSPTRDVFVHVTASAMLIDTRTGFVYAAFESSENRKMLSNVWESGETADRARRDAEKKAFKGLAGEIEKNWPYVLDRAKQGA